MIRINQLKLDVRHTEADLKTKVCKTLRIREDALISCTIKKQSLDARKKPQLSYVYTVDVTVKNEQEITKRMKKRKPSNIQFQPQEKIYSVQAFGARTLNHRPVVIGTGPAGLFCGYELARLGYRPVLLERGASVEERIKDVEEFWASGVLDPDSNVQFGEGGAGTFSDGKLNTMVHDSQGLGARVFEIFVENGAPKEILYQSKPHIGTDILADVVKNMREYIISRGGEVRFRSQVTDIIVKREGNDDKLCALEVRRPGDRDHIPEKGRLETEIAVLAIGHSARDTFAMLSDRGIPMEAKAFAVGVRVEHPQRMIDLAQYGVWDDPDLPPAAYKLTANLRSGRGVYTFCMCPGGYVVNASSEENRLAVNGMSYHARDGVNANSAVVVTVTPADYVKLEDKTEAAEQDGTAVGKGCGEAAVSRGCGDAAVGKGCGEAGEAVCAAYVKEHALAGVEFQRRLEEAAYRAGGGRIPVQLFEDFCSGRPSAAHRDILPQTKGSYAWGNVRAIFPEELAESLEEGIRSFGERLKGYDRPDAIVSGVESRTSSPVRILRDNNSMQSRTAGLYPCGEGAGYAGGITSAAIDGLKIAQAIAGEYAPFQGSGGR